jgi:hypothetical protein
MRLGFQHGYLLHPDQDQPNSVFQSRLRMPSTAFGMWMCYIKYRGKEGIIEDPIMKESLEDTSEIREL